MTDTLFFAQMGTYMLAQKGDLLKFAAVRRACGELGEKCALARIVIEKRIQKGLTQAAQARRIGTKQSAIGRLESGECSPTVGFLAKVARRWTRGSSSLFRSSC